MLRDNLVGLIEPMLKSAGAYPLALGTARKQSLDDRSLCLENPRPEGAESTLTENVASPFHAEPRHECVWFFSISGPPTGKSLDEMKLNFQVQLSEEFASHACANHPRIKGAKLAS